MRKIRKDEIWAYVFIMVPLCTFTIFTLYPVVSAAVTSFQEYKPMGSTWVGLENFKNTLTNDLFYKALKNTFVYSIVTVPLSMFLSFSISIMILPFKKRIQSLFKACYYLPSIASGVALSFVWKWIYDPLPSGLLNSVLRVFGIENQNWLGSGKTAMASLIIMAVFAGLGQNIIIYIAALAGISAELHEAAIIDGANKLQRIWHIDIPGILPTITILLIMKSGSIMSVGFEKVFLMQTSLNLKRSQVISTYVYQVGLVDADFSFSAAVGFFNSIVNFIMIMFVNFISGRVSETSLW